MLLCVCYSVVVHVARIVVINIASYDCLFVPVVFVFRVLSEQLLIVQPTDTEKSNLSTIQCKLLFCYLMILYCCSAMSHIKAIYVTATSDSAVKYLLLLLLYYY